MQKYTPKEKSGLFQLARMNEFTGHGWVYVITLVSTISKVWQTSTVTIDAVGVLSPTVGEVRC